MSTHNEHQTERLLHRLIHIMIRMEEQLHRLNNRSYHIMATLQEVKDEIEALKTRVSDEVSEVAAEVQVLVDEIKKLKEDAEQGTVVTPEQLDELVVSLKSIGEAVEAISGTEPGTGNGDPEIDPETGQPRVGQAGR